MEFVKESLTITRPIGVDTTQVLLEGDLIVPDVKPDVASILRADAEVFAEKKDVSADKACFELKLKLNALYLAKGASQPVHALSSSSSRDEAINIEGITRDSWVELKATVANVSYKMLNDRKISYRVVVDVEAKASEPRKLEFVSDISGLQPSQIKRKSITVNKAVDNREDRFIIKDELTIGAGKPAARELLRADVSIANQEVKVGNGRIHVNGDVIICALYRGDDADSVIEFSEHELPFSGAIDMPNIREGMFGDVSLAIADHNERVTKDSDGEDRVISIEVDIQALASVTSQSDVNALSDAYCIGKTTQLTAETVSYPNLVCRNKNQATVKDVVSADANAPDILQVFRVTGSARLTDIRVIDDKVIAEGVIDADTLYIAKNDDLPLYNQKASIPFRQIIETKGSSSGMDAVVEAAVDRVSFNMLSEREIEARLLVTLNTTVKQIKTCQLASDARFDEIDAATLEAAPSVTVYVANEGDTLWEIAKTYNTELDELAAVNDIEDGKVKPGQKLIILKKTVA